MIDTHAHLYLSEFDTDLAEVIQRAKDNDLEEIWIPGIDSESLLMMDKLRVFAPGFFRFFAGLHPCNIQTNYPDELKTIRQHLDTDSYTGIGEIGLDLHWDVTYFEEQKIALTLQLNWAIEQNLPVIIHVRDAFEEMMPLIRPFYSKGLKGIFHSFAGNQDQATELTQEGGFLLGINGNITYKKAPVALFLKSIPLNHIVTETDAPYLTPIPHRGKRNESSYIPLIIRKLSEIYDISEADLQKQTVLNARRLLG